MSGAKVQVVDGKITTYGLEFFAVDHCNLSCLGCAQSSPYLPESFADVNILERDLVVLKRYLRPGKFTILGGEPLLHPEIDKITELARASGMFDKICVTTNGLRLTSMTKVFWSNVHSVRVSIYPATRKYLEKAWPKLVAISTTYGVRLEERPMPQFNIIVHPNGHTDQNEASMVYAKCIYKHYCHTLRNGVLYRCSPVVHMDGLFAKMRKTERVSLADSLTISDSDTFQKQIATFFLDATPLRGCQFCFGSTGPKFVHRQMTTRETEDPQSLLY